jgi:DNA-binding PadR family transcriptional regulator
MPFFRYDGCRGSRHGHGPFGRGRGERGAHHGGGRGGRILDHGDLRFVILQLLAEKPRHGYEIIKAMEEKTGGAYSPSPGVVYPTLTLLDELGYAATEPGEGSKKAYAITPEGQALLNANRATTEAIFARLAEVAAATTGGAPQVRRAIENLKLALRMRLGRGPLSEEQLRLITAALDNAATTIEQI